MLAHLQALLPPELEPQRRPRPEREPQQRCEFLHLRRGGLGPLARNSVNARATRAETVPPDSRARSRTRSASATGNLTVNTTARSGTTGRPDTTASLPR